MIHIFSFVKYKYMQITTLDKITYSLIGAAVAFGVMTKEFGELTGVKACPEGANKLVLMMMYVGIIFCVMLLLNLVKVEKASLKMLIANSVYSGLLFFLVYSGGMFELVDKLCRCLFGLAIANNGCPIDSTGVMVQSGVYFAVLFGVMSLPK